MDNPYPICENCIFVDEPLDKDPCQECNRAFLAMRIKPNFVSKRKPKTNYDRIVSMKLEELAIAICTDFGGIPWCKNIPECHDTLCVGCVVKWMKQESTNES